MKLVLMDSSSAILLYHAGIMEPFISTYPVGITEAVQSELTAHGGSGATEFAEYIRRGHITLVDTGRMAPNDNHGLSKLDHGEQTLIQALIDGAGRFIVIDDKKGAQFLRAHDLPYINALLVPRILRAAGALSPSMAENAFICLKSRGRYASWIIDYASSCPMYDLRFFMPHRKGYSTREKISTSSG